MARPSSAIDPRDSVSEASPSEHLIRRREVARWLAGSAVSQATVHVTNAAEARRIRAEGVAIERSGVDTSWGRGIYSSTIPDWQYGDTQVRVAVRLLNPLVITDALDGAALIDALLTGAATDDVREAVQAAGHDGVVIHFAPGDLWVVAYRDDQVRVVSDA
jgi:hypothetical protein